MAYETRTYERTGDLPGWSDPVVVMVVAGSHDVSRLVAALSTGTVEQLEVGQRIVRQLRRHNTGRHALKLLRDHGGPDFTAEPPADQRVRELEAEVARLTDAVVTAAALHFGEITAESERDYASEVLHETAADLIARYPRLRGAYNGHAAATT